MIKQLTASLLLLAALTSVAAVPRRAVGSQASLRPQRIERTSAADKPQRNFAATWQRGLRTAGLLVDGDATSYSRIPAMRVPGDGTAIYGSMIYSDAWNGYAYYGLYSFRAETNPAVTPLLSFGSYPANGGGTYADGKYYYNSYVYTDEMGYTFSTFLTVDLATEEVTKVTHGFINEGFDQTQITHDLTYDNTTGTIYAICYKKETVDDEGLIERYRPAIGTVDTYTGMVTPIASTPQFIAIACNAAGELYGITKGTVSALYRINKTTGESTEIGRTGLTPEYVQSAAFDPVTDKLYWAETQINGTSGLYQVDLATGKAEPICPFPNNEEFAGIYIPAPAVNAGAPSAATDLAATFAGGSLTGSVSFTVPAQNYAGNSLTGALTADVEVDGESHATVDVTAGQHVSLPLSLAEGLHRFNVTVSGDGGTGPRVGHAWYVGIDGPAAVGNLTLAPDADGKPVISWTAPAIGRNNGYIDPARLTYTVRRMPHGAVVAQDIAATTFTDSSSFDSEVVYYEVTPYCGGREGVAANTAEALFGTGTELPVTYDFETRDDFRLVTIVDANNDYDAQYHWGAWMYSPDFPSAGTDENCLVYGFSPENAADDWAFMPPFTAVRGKAYRVTFHMWTRGDREKLSVTAGPDATPASQTVILPENTYTHKDDKTYVTEFTATADGNCFVGFHCTSDRKRFYLYVDNVTIDEVPATGAPAAVTDFTVTAGAAGALSATIGLTAPSVDASGAKLTSISAIDIYRGNDRTSIHTFASPAPGAKLTWTDNNAVQGVNTYRAVASNADGAGEKALASAYVGHDLPVACTEVTLSEENGHPVVRWVAPEEGRNGGYVSLDNMVFRIMRNDGTLVASHAPMADFVDMSVDGSTKQHFLYYQVQAVSPAGVGDYALTNHLVFGEPYKGDFYESFSDVSAQNDPWVMYRVKGDKQLWTLMSQGYYPYCPAADGDNGLAVFESTSGRVGDAGRLVSPKLYIADMNVPVFSFAFFHNPDEGTVAGEAAYADRLIPELQLPDGTFVPLDSPLFVDNADYEQGWYLYVYDLSRFKDREYVQLSFQGIAGGMNDVYVDYIALEDNNRYDLLAYTFSGPATAKVGKTAKYRLRIFNNGMQTAENFTVKLLRDGIEYAAQPGRKLDSGRFDTYEFIVPYTLADENRQYVYAGEIDYAPDEIPANNGTRSITTRVLSPDVPQPRHFDAVKDGENGAVLTWGDADAQHVSDSFEDYAAFAIDEIGDYTVVDGDKGITYTFQQIDYDYSGDAKAFQVFNPYAIGIAMLPEWCPRTGYQCMAAFSAVDYSTGKAIDSDDWFITPELIGGTQVSFWAKTANYEFGDERFQPMYSTLGTDPASFRALAPVVTAENEWVKYTYTLPAEARYFAVHYVSNDAFIFYLDDMTYTARCTLAGETHTGYRIYRNGNAIADVAADCRTYAEQGLDQGEHSYAVTALFGKRESKPVGAAVHVGSSALDTIDATAPAIVAGDGKIIVTGAGTDAVSVANAAGMEIFSADNADSYVVPVASGVYMVRCGQSVAKIFVK